MDRIRQEVGGVRAQYGITSWEWTFLASIQDHPRLTKPQADVLATIERKAFPDDNTEDE